VVASADPALKRLLPLGQKGVWGFPATSARLPALPALEKGR